MLFLCCAKRTMKCIYNIVERAMVCVQTFLYLVPLSSQYMFLYFGLCHFSWKTEHETLCFGLAPCFSFQVTHSFPLKNGCNTEGIFHIDCAKKQLIMEELHVFNCANCLGPISRDALMSLKRHKKSREKQ